MVGKADSIHCSQGMTIGKGQQFERVLGKWSGQMEKKIGPGLFYVFASRCKSVDNIALHDKLSMQCVQSIASTDRFKTTLHQDQKHRHYAKEHRLKRIQKFATLNPHDPATLGSKEDLKLRMHWLYTTCKEIHKPATHTDTNSHSPMRAEVNKCLAQWRQSFLNEFRFDFDEVNLVPRTSTVVHETEGESSSSS